MQAVASFVMVRCVVRLQAGKLRQHLTFAVLAVATVALYPGLSPRVARPAACGRIERLLAQGKVEQSLEVLREAVRLGRIPINSAGTMLEAALKTGEPNIVRDLALLLMNKGRPLAFGLVGRAAELLDAAGDASGRWSFGKAPNHGAAGRAGDSAPGRPAAQERTDISSSTKADQSRTSARLSAMLPGVLG